MTETQHFKPELSGGKISREAAYIIIYSSFASPDTEHRRRSNFLSFDARPDLEQLAREQGAPLAANFDNLLGDFWPEGESVDDFLAARERWRREGRNPDS